MKSVRPESIALEDLPETIRRYREAREERLNHDRQSALLSKEEQKYRGMIIEALRERGDATGGLVVDGRVTGVSPSTSFRINDWQALWKYVKENDAPDVFSIKLSSQGVKSRSEDFDKLGVEIIETYTLYDRKAE
jgi:hypothetical protein